MSISLHGKNALITGAGQGIGYEAAIIFAQNGANVLMVDLQKTEQKDMIATRAAEVKAKVGGTVVIESYEVDVSEEKPSDEAMKKDHKLWAFEEAVKKAKAMGNLNRLDIMFNNAGIQHKEDTDILDGTKLSSAINATLGVNVKGVLHGCMLAIEAMKQTGGSIINSSNFAALVGSHVPHVVFAASKGAVLSITRELAVAYAKDKIRVNSLVPGPVKTPQSFDVLNADSQKEWLKQMPLGRAAEPAEIANAALFLASDLSKYITGTEIVVDGGASINFLARPEVK